MILLLLSCIEVDNKFWDNVICCNLCCCCCCCCLYCCCCGGRVAVDDNGNDDGVFERIWKWGEIGVFDEDWEDVDRIGDIWDKFNWFLDWEKDEGCGDLVWVRVFDINLWGEDKGGSFEK